MHITALDHIVLEVADVEKAVTFYSLLGPQAERLGPYRRGEVKFPSMRISNETLIDLFPPQLHGDFSADGQNLNHFALVSELPIDAIREGLQARSIRIEEEMDHNYDVTPSGAGHLISEMKVFNEKTIATSCATGSRAGKVRAMDCAA